MDQGLTKSRLYFSLKKHRILCLILLLGGMILMGGWNVYKQWQSIRSDRAIIQEMESSLQASQEGISTDEDTTEEAWTPEKQRQQNELNWADLQVQYYDARVATLINTNQQIARYFQKSLLNRGDLMDMPCYQIRFSLKRLMNPALPAEASTDIVQNFSATGELYQSNAFYENAKKILKDSDISEVYIDELIDMNYDPLSGIVSLKAYHPNSDVAKELANVAYTTSHATLLSLGFQDSEVHRIDEGARREAMMGLDTRRRDLLRDMKTNQDELTILKGQEPPKSQQQKTDQKVLPSVRSFQLRSFILYVAIGFVLGGAVSVLLLVLDALRMRNVLFVDDYTEEGASAVVSWGKVNEEQSVLSLREAEDVVRFLKEFYPGEKEENILLLTPQSFEELSAFTPFAQSIYPTDGSMILPEAWHHAHKVVLFAPEKSLTRKVYEPLKTALTLAHQKIDTVVLMRSKA